MEKEEIHILFLIGLLGGLFVSFLGIYINFLLFVYCGIGFMLLTFFLCVFLFLINHSKTF